MEHHIYGVALTFVIVTVELQPVQQRDALADGGEPERQQVALFRAWSPAATGACAAHSTDSPAPWWRCPGRMAATHCAS